MDRPTLSATPYDVGSKAMRRAAFILDKLYKRPSYECTSFWGSYPSPYERRVEIDTSKFRTGWDKLPIEIRNHILSCVINGIVHRGDRTETVITLVLSSTKVATAMLNPLKDRISHLEDLLARDRYAFVQGCERQVFRINVTPHWLEEICSKVGVKVAPRLPYDFYQRLPMEAMMVRRELGNLRVLAKAIESNEGRWDDRWGYLRVTGRLAFVEIVEDAMKYAHKQSTEELNSMQADDWRQSLEYAALKQKLGLGPSSTILESEFLRQNSKDRRQQLEREMPQERRRLEEDGVWSAADAARWDEWVAERATCISIDDARGSEPVDEEATETFDIYGEVKDFVDHDYVEIERMEELVDGDDEDDED